MDYTSHLVNDTFKKLGLIDGFISGSILTRDVQEGVEFLVVTEWDDIQAIRKFAGDDELHAVVPKIVSDMMVRFDHHVRHFEVRHRA